MCVCVCLCVCERERGREGGCFYSPRRSRTTPEEEKHEFLLSEVGHKVSTHGLEPPHPERCVIAASFPREDQLSCRSSCPNALPLYRRTYHETGLKPNNYAFEKSKELLLACDASPISIWRCSLASNGRSNRMPCCLCIEIPLKGREELYSLGERSTSNLFSIKRFHYYLY